MAEKIATRAAYGKALVELADQEPNLVVLDADLSGSTMTKEFAAAHPDRFFDMGIAEANMVGVALDWPPVERNPSSIPSRCLPLDGLGNRCATVWRILA